MKTVLGIDLGTQSTKVMFYDYEERSFAAVESAPHELISAEGGVSEQLPAWWRGALREALDRVPEEIRYSAEAVAVSGQQHGFVPLDGDGNVLYQAKLWNDTSTTAECREITEAFGGEERLIKEVGNPILPGYTAGKILWLKKHQAGLYSKMKMIMLPHDYINYLLTGEYSMEYGDASGTGLLNVSERSWNRELCDIIDQGLFSLLPELKSPEKGSGRLTRHAAGVFGLKEGIPVATGGGDNMMAAIGTGAVTDGAMTMSLGTSGTLFGYSSAPVVDDEGLIAAFCSSDGAWLPLLCTMNCTVATENNRELLGVELSDLDDLVNGVPAGSDGVVVLPYFTGERIPNMPSASAGILGLNMTNSGKGNILRASMEAAIYGLKIGLDRLRELGMNVQRITLTGGGSRSRVWRQIAADITGAEIVLPVHPDSAAYGAALQALWYLGIAEGKESVELKQIVEEHGVAGGQGSIQPGPDEALYRQGYKRYEAYLSAIKPLYEQENI